MDPRWLGASPSGVCLPDGQSGVIQLLSLSVSLKYGMSTIDFRKNANVISAIYGLAKPKHGTTTDPFAADGYELHASDATVSRLQELLQYVPDSRFSYIYGIPVLSTSAGRIFATAGGTHYLYLFLPEDNTWGEPCEEYGKPWRVGRTRVVGRTHTQQDEENLAALLRIAYLKAADADRPR